MHMHTYVCIIINLSLLLIKHDFFFTPKRRDAIENATVKKSQRSTCGVDIEREFVFREYTYVRPRALDIKQNSSNPARSHVCE